MIFSVDDGCASDVRLAKLCDKYEINLIVYLPIEWHGLAYYKGYEPLKWDSISDLLDLGVEFGSHTITHRHLTAIPLEEAKYEIEFSYWLLQDIVGEPIFNFCPPRGYTNQELTEFTLLHYSGQRLTKGEGLVHVHPNSGVNGNIPWQEYVKTVQVKQLWGHSYDFDKYDMWGDIEEYLREVTHRQS